MNEQIEVPVITPAKDLELAKGSPGKEEMKTVSESTEIFQLMEARDEEQMLQEVMGVFSKEYVYDIPFKGGKTSTCQTPGCQLAKLKQAHTHVRGLSWCGIKEARRIFKAIDTREVSRPEIIDYDGKKYYECKVTAVDLRTGNVTTTYKRHPLMKQRKDGTFMEDPYAFEVVQSKAKRNAISELLPQPLVRAWIGDWVSGKKDFDVKHVTNLKEGEDFNVQKDSQSQSSDTNKGYKGKSGGGSSSSKEKIKESPVLPKVLIDQINSTLADFEAKGGIKAFDAKKQYCTHFKVTALHYISIDQAKKLIKAVNERIAKLKADVPGEQEVTKGDNPDTQDTTKAQDIEQIKKLLEELGWDLTDPKMVASLLKPCGLEKFEDLQRADGILVKEVLAKVTNVK